MVQLFLPLVFEELLAICIYHAVCVQLTGVYVQLAFWFTDGASVRYVIYKMLRGVTAQSKRTYKSDITNILKSQA